MKEQDILLIKLFIVEGKYYVYDTSTNRILSITKNHYLELIELLRLGVSAYLALNKNNKEYSDILRMMSLGLFRTNLIRNVGYYDKYLIPQMIDRCLNSVIFQVTKNCNFKCRYCLYASNTGVERNHSSEVMSFDVAKRTLDYLYSHSKDSAEISLSFYGGEPLLNFKLIREIVEYAEEIFVTKKLRYNITTNGSILTN